jgi:hypothetical protein
MQKFKPNDLLAFQSSKRSRPLQNHEQYHHMSLNLRHAKTTCKKCDFPSSALLKEFREVLLGLALELPGGHNAPVAPQQVYQEGPMGPSFDAAAAQAQGMPSTFDGSNNEPSRILSYVNLPAISLHDSGLPSAAQKTLQDGVGGILCSKI